MTSDALGLFEQLCDEHSDTYLTYDDNVWCVYIGLNQNHGIYDACFEGPILELVLKDALEWNEYEEEPS